MRRRIGLVLAGPLLALALGAVSACGGDDDELGVPTANGAAATAQPEPSGDTGSGDPRKFAQCIRDNGVPDFPDPAPSGGFTDSSVKGLDRQALVKAMEACQELAPAGVGNATAKMSPDQAENWTKFAGCMRDSGIAVPDPDPNGSLLDWLQSWRETLDPGDSTFRKTAETCQQQSGINLGGGGR